MFAYVGCYTTPDRGGRGAGIGIYRVDQESGDWTPMTTGELIRVDGGFHATGAKPIDLAAMAAADAKAGA